jgi:hypothetical protein
MGGTPTLAEGRRETPDIRPETWLPNDPQRSQLVIDVPTVKTLERARTCLRDSIFVYAGNHGKAGSIIAIV